MAGAGVLAVASDGEVVRGEPGTAGPVGVVAPSSKDPLWKNWLEFKPGELGLGAGYGFPVSGQPLVGVSWKGTVPKGAKKTPLPSIQAFKAEFTCSPDEESAPANAQVAKQALEFSTHHSDPHARRPEQYMQHLETEDVHVLYEKAGEHLRPETPTQGEVHYFPLSMGVLDCRGSLRLDLYQLVKMTRAEMEAGILEAEQYLKDRGFSQADIDAAVAWQQDFLWSKLRPADLAPRDRAAAMAFHHHKTQQVLARLAKLRDPEPQPARRELARFTPDPLLSARLAKEFEAAGLVRLLESPEYMHKVEWIVHFTVAIAHNAYEKAGSYLLGSAELGATDLAALVVPGKRQDLMVEFDQDCRAIHQLAEEGEASPFCYPGARGLFVLTGSVEDTHMGDGGTLVADRMVLYLEKA